jgi:hypothetical protein
MDEKLLNGGIDVKNVKLRSKKWNLLNNLRGLVSQVKFGKKEYESSEKIGGIQTLFYGRGWFFS